MPSILSRYASLLTHYCLRVTPGDKILISSTTLAEPLVREVYREALSAGAALVECDLAFRERELILLQNGSNQALQTPPTLTKLGMETFDCYLATSGRRSTCGKCRTRRPIVPKSDRKPWRPSTRPTSSALPTNACAATFASIPPMRQPRKRA
jgi:leucyl aminopeptidase (aminopeptidase T)